MAEPGGGDLASAGAKRPRSTEDQDLATGKRHRTTEQQKLLADLKSMVNDAERSDVVFRCSDGVAVHASRWLLANRCTFFEGMFRKGMVESNLSEIPLPTIPSRVMLSVVEFLYTGAIDSYPLLDWKMGLEMRSAGNFFMIETLEVIPRNFLIRMVLEACMDGQQDELMRMLNEAVEFEADCHTRFLLGRLISHIHVDWFAPSYSCELSRAAVNHLLCESRWRIDLEKNPPSTEEYCILRNIVFWHVHQATKDEKVYQRAEDLLPRRELLWGMMLKMPDVDDFLSTVKNSMDSCDPTAVLNIRLGVEIDKGSLEQMLQQHVNLSGIPASLLLALIHPLKLFPPGQLFKAVLRGALCRRVHRQMLQSDFRWQICDSLDVRRNGYISCTNKKRSNSNTVVAYPPGPTPSDNYEWSFTILEDDFDSIDLGLIFVPRGNDDLVNRIVKANLQDFSSETLIVRINPKSATLNYRTREPLSGWANYRDRTLEAKLVVTFSVSEEEEICNVQIGGDEEEYNTFVCPSSEEYTYLPAVCFNDCVSGSVQFELLGGFDYF